MMCLKSLREWCVSKSIPISFVLFIASLFTDATRAQSSADFSSASAWQANGSLAQLGDGGIPESTGIINPYFANTGALGWLRDSSRIPSVLKYIQWYIQRINPSGSADVWGYGELVVGLSRRAEFEQRPRASLAVLVSRRFCTDVSCSARSCGGQRFAGDGSL